MHEGNHDIKTSEPEEEQIVIIEQLRNPDLQDSDERNVNNKADVVLENIKVQNTTELEKVKKNKRDIEMHISHRDIKTSEPEDAQIEIVEQLKSPDSQYSNERTNNKANVVLENVKVQKSTKKREDHFKIASPLPLSEVNTGTIPPDINTNEMMYRSCNKEQSGDSLRKVEFTFASEDKTKRTIELGNMKEKQENG